MDEAAAIMLRDEMRLGVALSWLLMALIFLGSAVTINRDWRRRRRPRGLEWNQRGLVVAALVLLGVAVCAVLFTAGL